MNQFGRLFRVMVYGESHGSHIGCILDGVPAGIPLEIVEFEFDLSRRRGGTKGTTPRVESDIPQIISGVFEGKTSGSPLHIQFANTNVDSSAYSKIKDIARPGHADFVANQKFKGFQDYRGGGHFSGRLTACLVAAGVVAKKIINTLSIESHILELGGMTDLQKAIQRAEENQDSIGGVIECVIKNVPIGLGEPFFDSIESQMSHLLFSIPAIKGIEFGSGFSAARMYGSEHNDSIYKPDGATLSNHAGGINGGISNGNEIVFRVAVKPTSSIKKTQQSIQLSSGEQTELRIEGRHDLCIALRVPVVVEAVAAIVMADFSLIHRAYK